MSYVRFHVAIAFLVALFQIHVVISEITASILENVVFEEIKFVKSLKAVSLQNISSEHRYAVESYISDFEEVSQNCRGCNSTNDVWDQTHVMVYNPLSLYRIFHRLVHDYARVMLLVPKWGWITKQITSAGLRFVTEPIAHMAFTDNLDIRALANGHLLGVDLGVTLNARHCYEIGNHAEAASILAVAIRFYELALDKAVLDGSIAVYVVEGTIQKAILQHDLVREKYEMISAYPAFYLFDRKIGCLRRKYGRRHYLSKCRPQTQFHIKGYTLLDKAFNLCHRDSRGNIKRDEDVGQNFKCWHETQTDLYWTLHPLRVEEIARDPDFVLIRNAIGPKRILSLKKCAVDNGPFNIIASGSQEFESEGFGPASFYLRLHLNDKIFPPPFPLPRLLEKLTGLSAVNEVTEYPNRCFYNSNFAGGNLQVHMDNHHPYDNPYDFAKANFWDETVATVMIYLDIPEIGGETYFLPGNVTIAMEEGTAAIWYSLRKDGSHVPSYHGFCTSLLGRKWTVNKQFEYCDQFGINQCALSREEMFRFPRSYKRSKRFGSK